MLPVVSVRSACNTYSVFSVPHNMLPVVSARSACNMLPVFSVHVACSFSQFLITCCLLFSTAPPPAVVHGQAQIQGVPRFWTVSDKVTRNSESVMTKLQPAGPLRL